MERKQRKVLLEKSLQTYVAAENADGEEERLRVLLKQRDEVRKAAQKALWNPQGQSADDVAPGPAAVLPPGVEEEALQDHRYKVQEELCTLPTQVPVQLDADDMLARIKAAGTEPSGEDLSRWLRDHFRRELSSLRVAQWRCAQAPERHASGAALGDKEQEACLQRDTIVAATIEDHQSRLARLQAMVPAEAPPEGGAAGGENRDAQRGGGGSGKKDDGKVPLAFDVRAAVEEGDLMAASRNVVHRDAGGRAARWLLSRISHMPYTARHPLLVAIHRILSEPQRVGAALSRREGSHLDVGLEHSEGTLPGPGPAPGGEASSSALSASSAGTGGPGKGAYNTVPMMVMDAGVLARQLADLLHEAGLDAGAEHLDKDGHQANFRTRTLLLEGAYAAQTTLRESVAAPGIERTGGKAGLGGVGAGTGGAGLVAGAGAAGGGSASGSPGRQSSISIGGDPSSAPATPGPTGGGDVQQQPPPSTSGLSSLVGGGLDFDDPSKPQDGDRELGLSGRGDRGAAPQPKVPMDVQVSCSDWPARAARMAPSVGGGCSGGHGAIVRDIRYQDKLLHDENGFLDEPEVDVMLARLQELAATHEERALAGAADGGGEEVRARFSPSSGREWGAGAVDRTTSRADRGAGEGGAGEGGEKQQLLDRLGDVDGLSTAKLEASYCLRVLRSRGNKLRCLHAVNVSVSLRRALALDEEVEEAVAAAGESAEDSPLPVGLGAQRSRLDTYAPHPELGVRALGPDGRPVLHDRARVEFAELESEVVAVGSHFVELERQRLAEQRPAATSMWKAVDRLAVLADLWEYEARFAQAKQALLSAYRSVYERVSGLEARAALRREMVDVMFRRPGLDPASEYFAARYASEVVACEMEARLMSEAAEHVAAEERRRAGHLASAVAAASRAGAAYPTGLPPPLLGPVSPRLEGLDLLPSLEALADVPARLRAAVEELWPHCQLRGEAARRTVWRAVVTQGLKEWRGLAEGESARARAPPPDTKDAKDVVGMQPEARSWLVESEFADSAVAMDAAMSIEAEVAGETGPTRSGTASVAGSPLNNAATASRTSGSSPMQAGRSGAVGVAHAADSTPAPPPDPWAVAMSGLRVARLRAQLLDALYECEVLAGCHVAQARALGKELLTLELEPIDFDGKVQRPTRIDDVEEDIPPVSPTPGEGGVPRRLPPLAVAEFSADMADMDFHTPGGVSALLRPHGLRLLSQAVLAQALQRECLHTAVRHNQVLLDSVNRQLAIEEDAMRRESAGVPAAASAAAADAPSAPGPSRGNNSISHLDGDGDGDMTPPSAEVSQVLHDPHAEEEEERAMDAIRGTLAPGHAPSMSELAPSVSQELGEGLPRLSQTELRKLRGKLVADAAKQFLSLFQLKYSLRTHPLDELTARTFHSRGPKGGARSGRQSREEVKGELLREYAAALAGLLRPYLLRTQLVDATRASARAQLGPIMAVVAGGGGRRVGDLGPFFAGEIDLIRAVAEYGTIHDLRAVKEALELSAQRLPEDDLSERNRRIAAAAAAASAPAPELVGAGLELGAFWAIVPPQKVLGLKSEPAQLEWSVRLVAAAAGVAAVRATADSLAQPAGHVATGQYRGGRELLEELRGLHAQSKAIVNAESAEALLGFLLGRLEVGTLRLLLAMWGARDEFGAQGNRAAWAWARQAGSHVWDRFHGDSQAGLSRARPASLLPWDHAAALQLTPSERHVVHGRAQRLHTQLERLAEAINAMPSVEPEVCHDREAYYLRLSFTHARLKDAYLEARVAGLRERVRLGELPTEQQNEAVLDVQVAVRRLLPDVSVGAEGSGSGFVMSSPGRTSTTAVEQRTLEASVFRMKQQLDLHEIRGASDRVRDEVHQLSAGTLLHRLYFPDPNAPPPQPASSPTPSGTSDMRPRRSSSMRSVGSTTSTRSLTGSARRKGSAAGSGSSIAKTLGRKDPMDLLGEDPEVSSLVRRFTMKLRAQQLRERPVEAPKGKGGEGSPDKKKGEGEEEDGDLGEMRWGGVGEMVYEVREGDVQAWTCEVVAEILARAKERLRREHEARGAAERAAQRRVEALQVKLQDAHDETQAMARVHELRREAEVCTRGMELIIELEHMKREVDRSRAELDAAKDDIRAEVRQDFEDEIATLTKEIFTMRKNKELFQREVKDNMFAALEEVRQDAQRKMRNSHNLQGAVSTDKMMAMQQLEEELAVSRQENGHLGRSIVKLQTLYKLRGMARDLNLEKRWRALVLESREQNRAGWAAREEVERRSRSLRAQLDSTQTSLAEAEERVRTLERELALSHRNKQRLVKWKVDHQQAVSDLQAEVDSLARVRGIDVNGLIANLNRAEAQLEHHKEKEVRQRLDRKRSDFKPMEREVERLRELLAQERGVKESLMGRLRSTESTPGGTDLGGMQGEMWRRKYTQLRAHAESLLAQNAAMSRALHGFELLGPDGAPLQEPIEIPASLMDPTIQAMGSPPPPGGGGEASALGPEASFDTVGHLQGLSAAYAATGGGTLKGSRPASAHPSTGRALAGGGFASTGTRSPAGPAGVVGAGMGGGGGRPASAPVGPRSSARPQSAKPAGWPSERPASGKPSSRATPAASQLGGSRPGSGGSRGGLSGTFVPPHVPPLLVGGALAQRGLNSVGGVPVSSTRSSSASGSRPGSAVPARSPSPWSSGYAYGSK